MNEIARAGLGLLVILMCAAITAALFKFEIPDGNRDIAMVLLGVVLGWGGAVVHFVFGSSEGSKRKDARPKGTPTDPVHVEEE